MDRYKIVKNLGDGTYGTVYKAENKETGEIVAIKKMKRKYKNWDECMALREVKSLRKMNHPNLVKLKEVLQVKDELMLVFEYVDLNIYQMYMTYKEKKSQIPEKTIKKILFQIALGLDALHKIGFFHRDLKPENLLVNMKTLNVKLCDFGLAREVRCRPPFTEYVSTRWYRAPEILLHSQTYNSPVDIFAVGCIMAELYNLSPLFSGANELDQFYKMVNTLGTPTNWQEGVKLAQKSGMTIPTRVSVPLQQVVPRASPEGIQLLVDMLQYDPAKRPTALQITKYPYFDEIHRELGDINPADISPLGTAHSSQQQQRQQQQQQFNNSNNQQQYMKQQSSIGQFEVIPLVEKPIYNTQQIMPSQIYQQQQQFQSALGASSKALNPFQSYKDEYLKSQNAFNSKFNKRIDQGDPRGSYALQQQQQMNPAGLTTNYHFGKRAAQYNNSNTNNNNNNNNGMYSQLIDNQDQNNISNNNNNNPSMPLLLGGTLERPLNISYLNEVNKQARKQNMLLKRNYPQDSTYSQQQQFQNSQQPSDHHLMAGQYSPRQSDYQDASNFYNQFNKATNFNQNSGQQFQSYKNGNNNNNNNNTNNAPQGGRNSNSLMRDDQEGQNLNKIFEDKLNWAF